MTESRNWWLYVLELEDSKWYVGITSKTPEQRFAEHVAKKRAAYWTMSHRPLSIESKEYLGPVSKEQAEKYEDEITLNLMRERGINNVRGGNLRDTEDYVRKFGRIYLKDTWEGIIVSVIGFVSLLLNIYFILDRFTA